VLVQKSSPAGAGRGTLVARSAFERRLLPSLSRWFLERLEDCSPEYLIPVETKGARLLEAILTFAREQLGATVDVPVIYSTALPYLLPGTLENARVMIVDDAWRTGNNLLRHRERVEGYGALEVETVVCVGFSENQKHDERVWCFKRAPNDEQYRELLWQVAELVIARELPPEVDHHVYRLTVPQRLPTALAALEWALAPYGTVTVDALAGAAESIYGLTLHFPTLPGVRNLPDEGLVRREGANKLRFFPDPASGDIFVVPVSFPALEVEYEQGGLVSEQRARAVLDSWPGSAASLGRLLRERASCSTPETLFRTVSACAELDLVRGLAEVLAGVYPHAGVRLDPVEELLERLYGAEVGGEVGALIKGELAGALAAGVPQREDVERAGPRLMLESKLAEMTRVIAEGLGELYRERAAQPGHDARDRIGRSLSEIQASLPDADGLLVSRCMDLGLSQMTFVPYVNTEMSGGVANEMSGGVANVRRHYRVSETARDTDGPHERIDDVRRDVAEETVALIARFLRTRTERYRDGPIPVVELTWLVAILRVLVLEDQDIELSVALSEGHPVIQLGGGIVAVTLPKAHSDMFRLTGGGVVPTANFEAAYRTNEALRLDRRGSSIELETRLGLLGELIDAELTDEKLAAALAGWAMSSDKRLGLTHVLAVLDVTLYRQRERLKIILRGEEHATRPRQRVHEGGKSAKPALEILGVLRGDWQRLVRKGWPNPNKVERSVMASIAGPKDAVGVFGVMGALVELCESLGPAVDQLERASSTLWRAQEPEELAQAEADGETLAKALARACTDVRRTLRAEPDPRPHAGSVRDQLQAAARDLLQARDILASFAAALAGSYQGPKGQRAPSQLPPRREASVLFADITKSVERLVSDGSAVSAEWKNTGLNIAAQWARAFGGVEIQDRPGDAIWLDFGQRSEAALMCAAAIQQHMRALRSSDLRSMSWALHMCIDEGRLRPFDGGAVDGDCIDRSARGAKEEYEEKGEDATLISTTAAARIGAELREDGIMHPLGHDIKLTDAELPGALMSVEVVNTSVVMRRLRDRMQALAQRINEQVQSTQQLAVEEQPASEPAQSAIQDAEAAAR
jgi:hypothetical protein